MADKISATISLYGFVKHAMEETLQKSGNKNIEIKLVVDLFWRWDIKNSREGIVLGSLGAWVPEYL
jgi:hypothetical protein